MAKVDDYGVLFTEPLEASIVFKEQDGDKELFRTATVIVRPGDTINFWYPEGGIRFELD